MVLAGSSFLCTSCTNTATYTLQFGGDVMLDRGVAEKIKREGMHSLFSYVRPIFKSGTVSIVNFECTLTEETTPAEKKYVFRAPCSLAIALKNTGITHANLANNHALDYKKQGFANTCRNLEKVNIVPVGLSHLPQHNQFDSLKFALFGVNLVEDTCPAERNKFIYQPSVQSLIKNIAEYHSNYSEDVIIINIHWGFEYREFPTSAQRILAHSLIDVGATIIAGHHSHTVQPIEFYQDGVIIYSLGNLIFDQSSPMTRRSMVVSVDFKSRRIHNIRIFPLMIDSCIPRQCSRSDWGELDIIGRSNDRIIWKFVEVKPRVSETRKRVMSVEY